MLVLSRKLGESVRLGEGIEVIVQRISGNRVRLAIAAPPEVNIVRSELTPLPAAKEEVAAQHAAPLETV